jgi:hypothetical protein
MKKQPCLRICSTALKEASKEVAPQKCFSDEHPPLNYEPRYCVDRGMHHNNVYCHPMDVKLTGEHDPEPDLTAQVIEADAEKAWL